MELLSIRRAGHRPAARPPVLFVPGAFTGAWIWRDTFMPAFHEAGYDVHVWNRTAAKAQPLVDEGASVGETVRDLAQREVVFSMVSASKDLEQVMLDPEVGLLTGESVPQIVVDCSTVSV